MATRKIISKASIDAFLSEKRMAMIGVSQNKGKFGNQVFRHMLNNGYQLIPIHRTADNLEGISCVSKIDLLPNDITALAVLTPAKLSQQIVAEAAQKGIKSIWLQQMCYDNEALRIAEENNMQIVAGACLFMYIAPKGIHKFHYSLLRWFKKLPV